VIPSVACGLEPCTLHWIWEAKIRPEKAKAASATPFSTAAPSYRIGVKMGSETTLWLSAKQNPCRHDLGLSDSSGCAGSGNPEMHDHERRELLRINKQRGQLSGLARTLSPHPLIRWMTSNITEDQFRREGRKDRSVAQDRCAYAICTADEDYAAQAPSATTWIYCWVPGLVLAAVHKRSDGVRADEAQGDFRWSLASSNGRVTKHTNCPMHLFSDNPYSGSLADHGR